MAHDNDYQMDQLVKITFEDMPYWVMPRYIHHYVHNNYEKFSLKLIKNLIKKDDTFLDIGAHYGAYSIYAAEKCGANVISMEPVNENFEIFTKNIAENKVQKLIETHNAAASNEDTEAEFNIPWASDSAGFYDHPLAETYKKQTVQVRNVDNLVNGRKIDFIKIDTEGHELTVLAGLKKTLSKNPHVKLLIEANPLCLEQAGRSTKELLNYLVNEANKELFVIDEDAFTMRRITHDINNWSKYIHGYANILCVPKTEISFPLFICHSSDFGGGELALLENVEALRDRGIYSHVVLPNIGPLKDKLTELGISHNVFTQRFWQKYDDDTHINETLSLEASARISDLVANINSTVIVNNTIVCPWGVLAARQHKLPLIWFAHEFGDRDHNIKFNYDISEVRKFITTQADLVVTCSDAVGKTFNTATNVKTLYPLLHSREVVEKSSEKTSTIFKRKNSLKLIATGRVQETKGQLDIVKAVGKLKQSNIDIELVLLGNNEPRYLNKIKSTIKKLNLSDDVRYIDHAPNPFPLMKQADILVVSSREEAFGRVTAEAMLLGLPVIGTDTGGTSELVENNETGLLYTHGDIDQLAKNINALSDKKKRTLFSANAIKNINKLISAKANPDLLLEYLATVNNRIDRNLAQVLSIEASNAILRSYNDRTQMRRALDNYTAEREALEHDIAHMIDVVEQLSREQQALFDSTYWSLTRPIRGIFKAGRKIRSYGMHLKDRQDVERATQVYESSLSELAAFKRKSNVTLAIIIHLYYPESWPSIKEKLDVVKKVVNFDIFITTPDKYGVPEDVIKSFPRACILEVPNRGRDVLPFMQINPVLKKLGYESFLKLHSKRSTHRSDGSDWFAHILDNLVPQNESIIKGIIAKLGDQDTALIAPDGEYVSLLVNFPANKNHLRKIISDATSNDVMQRVNRRPKDFGFIAGTMFWGRFDALQPIVNQKYSIQKFEMEKGQIDSTFAHALERAFSVVPELNKKSIYSSGSDGISRLEYVTDNIPEWSDIHPSKQQ